MPRIITYNIRPVPFDHTELTGWLKCRTSTLSVNKGDTTLFIHDVYWARNIAKM